MKKIALLFVFIITLSLCGCSKNATKGDLEVDIEYYAKLGQMTDCEFALGADVKKLEELAEHSADAEHTHDEDAVYYEISEFDGYTGILAGEFDYYYNNDKKDNGIGCIISFEGGYGFESGSMAIEIKEKLSSAGFDAEERDATVEEAFFLPKSGSFTCLVYKFGNNTVRFIFEQDALCACSLSGVDWSI